ncbi:palmitoyltransferase [Anaeramoeba ignava]|uniref:mitogen-activated protein kinase kinase kinase n=1 Tax=Anaeramoeba ignava TaxID=1746090 RepID=A0A9Q0LMN5_ANAIG|nr:palmitoyltransferase [Anaeramoeba ignava]
MESIVCPICFETFSNEKKPIIICEQGHTICQICLKEMDSCPFCRSSFENSKLIINRPLLSIIEEMQKISIKTIPVIPLEELEIESQPFQISDLSYIYKAKWRNSFFALKKLRTFDIEKKDKFKNELNLIFGLNHPNLVQVHGIFEFENSIGILMDLSEEGNLKDKIANLSFEDSVNFSIGIVQGLAFLHRNAIIHRFLKPENILILKNQPRITDFGLSKLYQQESDKKSLTFSNVYIAPEILQHKYSFDTSCDIYSLSFILYQIFSKEKLDAEKFISEQKKPIISNNFPRDLAQLIQKGWSNDPKNRCSLNDFLKCLEEMRSLLNQKNIEDEKKSKSQTGEFFGSIIEFERDEKKPESLRRKEKKHSKKSKKIFGFAKLDFQSPNQTHLTFSIGEKIEILKILQDGWGEGLLDGKVGLIPLNFLEIIEEEIDQKNWKPRSGPKPVQVKIPPKIFPAKVLYRPPKLKMRAILDFKGENGELSFEVGDIVEVIEKDDSGWWKGMLNGVTGVFPNSFFEKI